MSSSILEEVTSKTEEVICREVRRDTSKWLKSEAKNTRSCELRLKKTEVNFLNKSQRIGQPDITRCIRPKHMFSGNTRKRHVDRVVCTEDGTDSWSWKRRETWATI
jgi:hypothetical protein